MKKGISLVALVITIIVLIILTATVMIMFNQGGIADRAEEAVFNTNFTSLIEMTTMANNDYMLENLGNGKINATTETELKNALKKYDNQNLLDRDIKGFKCYELLQIFDGKLYQSDMVVQEDKDLSDKLTALGIETLFREYEDTLGIFRVNVSNNGYVELNFKDYSEILENPNFESFTNLEELRIPNVGYDDNGNKYYVKQINNWSGKTLDKIFPNLKKIVISEGIEAIGISTFANCRDLETVELPSTLTIIYTAAFNHCESLKNITLPNGITTIVKYAFQDCKVLENITIPRSVVCLGEGVFLRCSTNLKINVDNTKEVYDNDPGNINSLWAYSGNGIGFEIEYIDQIIHNDGTVEYK